MTDLTSTGTLIDMIPQLGCKKMIVETPATADESDTMKVTLGSYGMNRLLGVTEHYHVTTESVMQVHTNINRSKCAVSSGVLTITFGTGSNIKRVFEVLGD